MFEQPSNYLLTGEGAETKEETKNHGYETMAMAITMEMAMAMAMADSDFVKHLPNKRSLWNSLHTFHRRLFHPRHADADPFSCLPQMKFNTARLIQVRPTSVMPSLDRRPHLQCFALPIIESYK